MHSRATTFLRIAAFSLLGLMLAAGSAAAQVVINENGDFEDAEAGQTSGITNWQLWLNEGATAEVVEDPDDAENLVLRVELTDTSVATNPWDIQVVHYVDPALELVEGHEHQVSFRIRAENPTDATVQLDGQSGAQLWGQAISGEDWTTLETGTFVAGAEDTRTIGIHLSANTNPNGQVFYIDDLMVVDLDAGPEPVIVEAESGTVGSEFETATDGDDTYISITTDFDESTGSSDYPGADRTASYEVTFPDSGRYDLYARVRVGPEMFDDDSFFYGSGFGEQDPADADAWTMVNGLANVGYAQPDDYVESEGTAGSEEWKWLRLTGYEITSEPYDTFAVSLGDLTQTFQIGAREDGLDIDKFAFGPAGVFYTVENLDNGEPGVKEIPGDPVPEPEGPPLAEGLDKFLGNIYSPTQTEHFAYYWNQVTPENAGKWGSVESDRDEMNWTTLDEAYQLAQDSGFVYRHHVLIWGAQQPDWISDLPANEQLEEIEEWFEAVAERYPDIDYLEVVNEPLPGHNPPDGSGDRADYKEALGGDGETGWDWVITAFEMAREIFPEDTKLMINDFGILGSTSAAQEYREIIELLQERDLIDGIGVQGHAFSTRADAPLEDVLDILGETGLPIQVTEMDVDGNPDPENEISEEESDQNQLQAMQRIFPAVWEHPSVEGVTFWGWRPGLWRNDQEAYLVRANGEERPALEWLRSYLETYEPTPNEPEAETPLSFRLEGNYPNPFNPSTQIRYTVAEPVDVTLTVFDLLGRQVATLVDARMTPGEHAVTFDARDLASGVYLYRLQAGSFVETRHMVLVK